MDATTTTAAIAARSAWTPRRGPLALLAISIGYAAAGPPAQPAEVMARSIPLLDRR